MPIDFAASLRRHYLIFLAVLVVGVILIIACHGTSRSTALYVDCVLGVAGLVSAYALAPAAPPGRREHVRVGPRFVRRRSAP